MREGNRVEKEGMKRERWLSMEKELLVRLLYCCSLDLSMNLFWQITSQVRLQAINPPSPSKMFQQHTGATWVIFLPNPCSGIPILNEEVVR